MKNLRLSIIMLLGIVLFTGCDDDSLFYPKVKTANGITTVSGIRPGGLEQAMLLCLGTVKHLVINDTIDSRYFETMRDDMPNLSVLDLSNATIAAYNGYEGTAGTRVYRYPANAIPEFAFYDPAKSKGKENLTSIMLPTSIKSIRDYAFNRCTGLKGTLEIPASVRDTIGRSAFSFCENLTSLTLSAVNYIGESAFQGCTELTSIYSKASTPIDLSHSATAFEGVKMGQCTLHVPTEAATNYQNAAIWKDFVDIQEN